MAPAAGKVRTQAIRMLPATSHRTAESRLVAPTPMIAEVIVWVVEIGSAEPRRGEQHTRGDGLGGEALRRVEVDDLAAQRADDPPAAGVGAQRPASSRRSRRPTPGCGWCCPGTRRRRARAPTMPMVFAASCMPWPTDIAAAETVCA